MRIVLADDHVMLRDGLKPYLLKLRADAEVFEAGCYDELLRLLERQPMDLALVDLRMPGMPWQRALTTIRRNWPTLRVAVLSSVNNRQTILDVLETGVVGFVPKQLSAQAMLSVLQLIMSGERFVPAALVNGDPGVHVARGTAYEDDGAPGKPLTARERQILQLLQGGMPNKAIARELDVSEVTVKSHLCNVFRKLGVQNRVQAARFSMQLEAS